MSRELRRIPHMLHSIEAGIIRNDFVNWVQGATLPAGMRASALARRRRCNKGPPINNLEI